MSFIVKVTKASNTIMRIHSTNGSKRRKQFGEFEKGEIN